jgi:LmbE family N-acetylglucosaminyl deacetylase
VEKYFCGFAKRISYRKSTIRNKTLKILFIAPHPDDETIGAGGTIVRHKALGDDIFWCIVTQGYTPPWPEEIVQKAREQITSIETFYGFKNVYQLGFPTVKLNIVPHMELCNALQNVIEEVKPDIVYTTSRNDVNLDHRIVYDCTLVASRPLPGNGIRRVLSYEIGYTIHFGVPSGVTMFQPNVFIDISEYLEEKLKAMRYYETELRQSPHPRNIESLRLLAKERGLCVGYVAAECFELVRELI